MRKTDLSKVFIALGSVLLICGCSARAYDSPAGTGVSVVDITQVTENRQEAETEAVTETVPVSTTFMAELEEDETETTAKKEPEFTNNYELVSASQGKGERWWEINVVARALVPGENIANVSNEGSIIWYILDGEGNRVSAVDEYGEEVGLAWPDLEYHGIATSADSYAVMTMKVNMVEKYPEGNYTLVCNMDGEERKVDLNISYD